MSLIVVKEPRLSKLGVVSLVWMPWALEPTVVGVCYIFESKLSSCCQKHPCRVALNRIKCRRWQTRQVQWSEFRPDTTRRQGWNCTDTAWLRGLKRNFTMFLSIHITFIANYVLNFTVFFLDKIRYHIQKQSKKLFWNVFKKNKRNKQWSLIILDLIDFKYVYLHTFIPLLCFLWKKIDNYLIDQS